MNDIRFKLARLRSRVTQQQLAEAVGLKEHDITRIETGRMMPDRELQKRIARVLRKPLHELFREETECRP